MNIGVYVASSQSGRAYLADCKKKGESVYGYCRKSVHGTEFVNTIYKQGGIKLQRPQGNLNSEESDVFISLNKDEIGFSLDRLIQNSEVIILAEPSIYFEDSVKELKQAGIAEKRIPIILSPCRTLQVPKLWKILGEGYPIVGFSTCIYSCKSPAVGISYIKRRKRTWIASIEGARVDSTLQKLKSLFPQCIWTDVPAITSLGNIGSVFHPSAYLLNYEDIMNSQRENREYSFYMEGIANKPHIGEVLEEIDDIRLKIARRIGIKTIQAGCYEDEKEWEEMLNEMHFHEKKCRNNIDALRMIRHEYLEKISKMVVSAPFWLDYTYGVSRKFREPLYQTIARTPTYQKMSVAQQRYMDEDVPTGLLPMYEMGKRYGIEVSIMEKVLKKYCEIKKMNMTDLHTLEDYSTEYITNYLLGRVENRN